MANAKEVSSRKEFEKLTASGVVLIDFYATWCRPCQMQIPVLKEVAEAVDGDATVLKVNTDQLPELAQAFKVSGIPHLVLLRDGQTVETFTGLQNKSTLVNAIRIANSAAV